MSTQRNCDTAGCGRPVEERELARHPAQVMVPGIGLVTVSFKFPRKIPDVCNACLLDAVATLDTRKDSGKVIDLGSRRNAP